MTRVRLTMTIADGVAIDVDRETDCFSWVIGQWQVELFGGKLIVRPAGAAINEGRDVLKVDA